MKYKMVEDQPQFPPFRMRVKNADGVVVIITDRDAFAKTAAKVIKNLDTALEANGGQDDAEFAALTERKTAFEKWKSDTLTKFDEHPTKRAAAKSLILATRCRAFGCTKRIRRTERKKVNVGRRNGKQFFCRGHLHLNSIVGKKTLRGMDINFRIQAVAAV